MSHRKKIVVPTSSAVSAYEASEFVMQIASLLNAEVHVLHVYSDDLLYDDCTNAFELFQLACEENGVRVKNVSVSGNIVREIVQYAEHTNANLILMGASPSHAIEEWISHQVFGVSKIPVLVLPNNTPLASAIYEEVESRKACNRAKKPWTISKLFQAWQV